MEVAREIGLRARFVLAQVTAALLPVGSGPRSMLLAVEDLPGAGWRRIDERRWRVGVSSERPDWVERARRAGRGTAWRSFEQGGGGRGRWTQATPPGDPAEAE